MSRPAAPKPSPRVAALLLMLASAAPAQDPPPRPPLVSEPEHRLQELEEQTRRLRDEVRAQLADPVADVEREARAAKGDWDKAVAEQKQAEQAATEYEQAILRQDILTCEGDVALARGDLDRARDRVAWFQEQKARNQPVNSYQIMAEELALERAKFDVEQAETQLDVLTKVTGPANIRSLQADARKAAEAAATQEREYQQRAGRLERRRAQVGRLKSTTPEDLVVALLDEVNGREERLATLTREAEALAARPAGEPGVADQLRDKQAQVRTVAEEIKATLADAVAVADEARALRQRLFRAEKQLLFERRALENPPK